MSLTPDQLRAARALLNISQDELARGAGVAVTSIRQFELGATANLQQKTENALLTHLGHKIEFIGTRGVALREADHSVLDGKDAIARLYEDIEEHLHGQDGAEILFLCGEPCLFTPDLAPRLISLKEAGFACRTICHDEKTDEPVRIIPQGFAPLALQAVYGSTVAQMLGPERILIARSRTLADGQRRAFELLWAAIPAMKAQNEAETSVPDIGKRAKRA